MSIICNSIDAPMACTALAKLGKPNSITGSANFYVSTYALGHVLDNDALVTENSQDEPVAECLECSGCAVWEQQMADMAMAWKQDVKERTQLKQELVKVKCLCAAKCQESAARAAEADSLTAQLVDVKMKLAVRDEEALAQDKVSKLRLRAAAAHVDEITEKLASAQSRVASLCSDVAAGKRTIGLLTDANAKLAQQLQEAKAAIARLALEKIDAIVAQATPTTNPNLSTFSLPQPCCPATPSTSVASNSASPARTTGEAETPAVCSVSTQSSAASAIPSTATSTTTPVSRRTASQVTSSHSFPQRGSHDTGLVVLTKTSAFERVFGRSKQAAPTYNYGVDRVAEPVKLRWWMKRMPSCMRPQ